MDVVDVTELLPEDVLADVLRRLAPRWLAASRCVCRSWRATVDSHGLVHAVLPLLPRSVAGIFVENRVSHFLCRPSTGPAFSADLHYMFTGDLDAFEFEVRDHCNGLVLLEEDCVVNPATRQWTRLPPRPPRSRCMRLDLDDDLYRRVFYDDVYLVFDPTMTPQFEVYYILRVKWRTPSTGKESLEWRWPASVEQPEWPPSPCILHVFSSETGQWEERSFIREGPAAGTVADMLPDTFPRHRYAVYWRGTLYVQCQTDFIMRSHTHSSQSPPGGAPYPHVCGGRRPRKWARGGASQQRPSTRWPQDCGVVVPLPIGSARCTQTGAARPPPPRSASRGHPPTAFPNSLSSPAATYPSPLPVPVGSRHADVLVAGVQWSGGSTNRCGIPSLHHGRAPPTGGPTLTNRRLNPIRGRRPLARPTALAAPAARPGRRSGARAAARPYTTVHTPDGGVGPTCSSEGSTAWIRRHCTKPAARSSAAHPAPKQQPHRSRGEGEEEQIYR